MTEPIALAILSSVLVTVSSLITWFFKSRKEELVNQELKVRENKIQVYETLLEPFIGAFTNTLSEKEKQEYINKLLTIEYRKAAFNLTTFGSDQVVTAYNKIMQDFFNPPESEKNEIGIIHLKNFSNLLLMIRRDLYSKRTKLRKSQMLEFMINDIKNYKEVINK